MPHGDAPAVKAGRFLIRRSLGAGGFGEVFEAFDQVRLEDVALKVLRQDDASALYRFKQEFRTLANLAHPHLVTLHELIGSGDEWLLSMELIRGGTFLEFVRRAPGSGTPETGSVSPDDPTVSSPGSGVAPRRVNSSRLPLPLETLDLGRLRICLRQLAEAVHALHANGILHLDIKPSNVLVSDDGRVVVVDFGLAERFDARRRGLDDTQIIGTPHFMSPEQAAGHTPTEASDWYCVGALLYRALTGLNTFAGDSREVIRQKLAHEPAPASELVPGVPADLEALCRDLLRRDPAARPTGEALLERLGVTSDRHVPAERPPTGGTVFVGRAPQLAALERAYSEMASGRPSAVHVSGRSGMGKSALVRRFVDGITHKHPEALVLEGRCYEHEALPFKAFDGLLDALSNHLRTMHDADVARLLPRGIEVLARIFPALRRVPAVASAQERTRIVDPAELRRRAFTALREFFARVAERFPLVIVIDDLQWGDLDSAQLLDELLRPPHPPPLLLVLCFRSDERDTSPTLRALFESAASRSDVSAPIEIEVAELDAAEAGELARSLLPAGSAELRAARIAKDTQGNPFFIEQLARHSPGDAADQDSIESLLSHRLATLPQRSRRFLEIVAVAGQPVDIAVVAAAAAIESGAFDVFASLRAARLIRSRSKHGDAEAEPYHDRIRELIVDSLPDAERASHHHQLALALEQSQSGDNEALMQHFKAGGDLRKAAHYAVRAADQSANALAFDGAARLYRAAIDLGGGGSDAVALHVKLGSALSMAGRVIESAEAYVAAARLAPPAERVDLQRRAGEQYLQGFHLERGLALLREPLSAMGMRVAPNTASAFVALVLRRLYIRWRGTAFTERAAADIPVRELQRVDLCSALCRGLGFTDSLLAMELQTRHLLLALKVGEPYRVARALTLSATADGVSARGRPRAFRYLQQAQELSERINNPFGVGIVHTCRGLLGLGAGRWTDARRAFDTATDIFREKCVAPPYTTMLCHVYRLEAVFSAGRLRDYFAMIPEFAAECQGRGDLLAEANLHLRQFHLRCFADDDIQGAAEELHKAGQLLGNHKLMLARNYFVFRSVEHALYAGDASRAWAVISSYRRTLLAMRLFGFQAQTTIGLERRAYAALAMAAAKRAVGESPRAFLARAARDARHIDATRAPFGRPIAQLVRGTVALQHGDRAAAQRLFAAARAGFIEHDMALHAAVARWREGMAVGGEAGRHLIDEAAAWMTGQGVRNPQRLCRLFAPAGPDPV